MQKYNLALTTRLPNAEIQHLVDELSSFADTYLLGPSSHPHITLYQFYAEKSELESLWHAACRELPISVMTFAFHSFSVVTFDEETYWVSLMPDHRPQLNEWHRLSARLLQKPVKQTYDPHMTLVNSKIESVKTVALRLEEGYKPISCSFRLSLGVSDFSGQFTQFLYSI